VTVVIEMFVACNRIIFFFVVAGFMALMTFSKFKKSKSMCQVQVGFFYRLLCIVTLLRKTPVIAFYCQTTTAKPLFVMFLPDAGACINKRISEDFLEKREPSE
jgi:hypothetical protein